MIRLDYVKRKEQVIRLMNQIWQQREQILAVVAWDRLAADEMKHASDSGYLRSVRTRQILGGDLRDLVAMQIGFIANVRKGLKTPLTTELDSHGLDLTIENIEWEMRMLRLI